jgi:heterodisulfide reductase subunit A
MSVDVLVLMVGFVPSAGTRKIGESLGLEFGPNKFIKPADEHIMNNMSSMPGVFVAGTATAPRTITNTIIDSRAAAAKVLSYLNRFPIEDRSIR